MTIVLPGNLQAWAEAEVAAGRAESVDRIVTDAVELRRAELEWVRSRIDEAREQVARGEVVDGEHFMAELQSWIDEDADAAA
jgi:Arc/MetJ-type ribon-helix-helix transcriptional regulator